MMAGKLQVVLLVVAVYAAQCSAQDEDRSRPGQADTDEYPTLSPPPPTPDPLLHNLQFSLPLAVVLIILVIMAVVVVIVMRKARYGQFCCFKPKMRFRYTDDEETGVKGPEKSQTPPPTYKMTDMVAPPGYTDALQDVVVSQEANTALQEEDDKETEEEREMVEVPLDENEAEDDCAPLNP